jgi:hypothetical protein
LLLIRPYLDERAWRLLLGAEAKVLGRGGIKLVAVAAAVHADTVAAGVRELDDGEPIPGRVRRPGAGRPPMTVTDPDLLTALEKLVDPISRGDPESPLRWTTKSTTKLATELTAAGHRVSARTVAKLLKAAGYSLQVNSKTIEGAQHLDRDAQFGYLNTEVQRFQAGGDPVISVDTKKKELVGNYKAAGREWEPAGSPRPVKVHDFADKQLGKVAPYGVYDIAANTGWVNVGTDAATGAFAVESIRRWWTTMGATAYPGSNKLLITADSGGSNRIPAAVVENRTRRFRHRGRTRHHRQPPAARHLQMEQDRTPAVLRDQPQLARTTPGIPRGCHRNSQSNNHIHRTDRERGARHHHL